MNFKNSFYGMFLFVCLLSVNSMSSLSAMITQADVETVKKLTADGKLPGRVSAYARVAPAQLVNNVVDVLITSEAFMRRNILPEYMGGTNTRFRRCDLTLILPDAIKDQVKIEYWARTKAPVSLVPLTRFNVQDAEILARSGRIPGFPVAQCVTLGQIAKYYVENYTPSLFSFYGWRIADRQHKMASWLRLLSTEFQNEVNRYYHCMKLKNNTKVWIDGNEINIPVSYFVECGILPLPDGVTLQQLKDFEQSNQLDNEATFFAYFIRNLDDRKNLGQLKSVVKSIVNLLPVSFINKVVHNYVALTGGNGRLLDDKKFFGKFSRSASFSDLLCSISLLEQLNEKINKSGILDLSGRHISSIKTDDFLKLDYAAVKTLILSGNDFDELPKDLLTNLPKLEKLVISKNPKLKTLPAGLFKVAVDRKIDLNISWVK